MLRGRGRGRKPGGTGGTAGSRPDTRGPAGAGLAASGRVDLDGLVTGRFDLERVSDALEAGTDAGSIKPVVRPGGV